MSGSEVPTEPEDLFRYAVKEGFDAGNRAVVEEAFADSVELLQSTGPDTVTPEQLWQEHQVERTALPDFTHEIQGGMAGR